MTDASYTKLFFPANLIPPCSIYDPMSAKSSHSNTFEVAEKAFAQLSTNSERSKRIQKAKEEIALDDWSTLDESMLDSEIQERLLNEARLLRQESTAASDSSSLHDDFYTGTSNVNGDSSREAIQLGFEDNFADICTIGAASDPIEDPHISHSPTEHFTLQAPGLEDCSIILDERSCKQPDLVDSKLHIIVEHHITQNEPRL